MKGPSKESGDCGGIAVWLHLDLESETFVSGEMNEYEGGCKAYPKDLLKVNHNPKTGQLSFLSKYFTSETNLKFEGIYYYKDTRIEGDFFQVEKDTNKQKFERKTRTLRLKN